MRLSAAGLEIAPRERCDGAADTESPGLLPGLFRAAAQ
ncbi:hypothetical protein HMPREF9413_1922 [Paenibacillus sp. HGF7]|nr:hypothetical protein HMPREF9413_1922 [Paenibacillus sp. HGF7]